MKRLRLRSLAATSAATAAVLFLGWMAVPAAAQPAEAAASAYVPEVGQSGKDVIWVPTSQTLVDRMLEMAQLTPSDRLVDLGSGDGRLVITAAKRGAVARGIEYNPDMVALSRRAAAAEGVAERATFEQADIFASDFSEASVVTLFLLPDLNLRLRPTLLDMKPGTRIVSNSFDMAEWQPDETAQVTEGCTTYCNAYKWVVPAKVQGTWRLGGDELELRQTFQVLEGTLRRGGQASAISDARLDGAAIQFTAGGQRYAGTVGGEAISGTIDGAQPWTATRSR